VRRYCRFVEPLCRKVVEFGVEYHVPHEFLDFRYLVQLAAYCSDDPAVVFSKLKENDGHWFISCFLPVQSQ